MIVGAYGIDPSISAVNAGWAMVFYGSLDGFSAVAPDWVLNGETAGDQYGVSVSAAGDVNGDGSDDVLVGACGFDIVSHPNVGKVYLYYGSATGLSVTPAWTASGIQDNQYFGYRVAGVGDLNGNGHDDIAIGSYNYDGGEGRVYVYYGSDTIPASTADWTAEPNQAGSRFGISVSGIGDVNGDGYDDLIAGADFYTDGTTNEGAAFAWFGSPAGLGDPDTTENADWMAESNQTTRFFAEFLGTPGDVNGDGIDDVAVDSLYYNNAVSNTDPSYREGKLWAYYSKAGVITGTVTYAGPIAAPHQIFVSAHLNLGDPPVESDVVFNGDNFKINRLEDSSYYIGAFLDANDSGGGPPDPGEPTAWYDPDHDGLPDLVEISGGGYVTGINIVIADWRIYLPLILR